MQAGHPSFLVMDFVSGCKHAATISVDAFRSFIEANELVVRCGVLFRPWVQHGSALVAGESIVFRLQARVSSLTVKCSKCSGLPPDLWICLHVCGVRFLRDRAHPCYTHVVRLHVGGALVVGDDDVAPQRVLRLRGVCMY